MNTPSLISRRMFLNAAAALGPLSVATLAGCARREDDDATSTQRESDTTVDAELKLALGWLPDVGYAGLWIALEQGYLRDGGINLSYEPGGPNAPAAVETVPAGQAHVGIQGNMQAFFDAVIRGEDLVLIGTQYQHNPAGLLSLGENPVLTAEDLVQATILGPSAVDAESITALLRMNDLPDDEFEFIPSGASVEPLLQKEGDAMVTVLTNQPMILELKNGMEAEQDFFFRSYDDFNLPRYSSVMFAERDVASEQHDVLVAFMRALQEGWTENESDPEFAAGLATDEYGRDLGLELEPQVRQNELQIPLLHSADTDEHGLFWIDKERLSGPMYEALRAGGRTDLPDVDSVVDMTILKDAAQ